MNQKPKNKNIIIYIESEYKEFYPYLANIFYDNNFTVKVFIKNNGIYKYVSNLLYKQIKIHNFETFTKLSNDVDVINKSIEYEKKYNFTFNFLMSQDRNLGQGYLLNTTKVPKCKTSSWEYKKKLRFMINKLIFYEFMCEHDSYLFFKWPTNLLSAIAKKNNTNLLSFNSVKLGNNFFLSDNPFNSSKRLKENLIKNLNRPTSDLKNLEFKVEAQAKQALVFSNDKLPKLIKNCLFSIINDLKIIFLGNKTDFSYNSFGWAKSYINAYFNYHYIEKIKINYENLNEYKIVYFPLHCEPEVSLLNMSPENNNSLEIISWISKSLPVNYLLILKEHPVSLGVRSKTFYKLINKLGNVFFVSTKTNSSSLINKCSFLATITGSASQEAVASEKNVLSFGLHQYLNILSTVYYCSNFNETFKNVHEIINLNTDIQEFKKNKLVLLNSLIDSSFEIKDFDKNLQNVKFASQIANKIFDEFIQNSISK